MDTILTHKSDSLKDTSEILKNLKKELINNSSITNENDFTLTDAKKEIKKTQEKYTRCLNSNFVHLNLPWHKSTKQYHEDAINMLDAHITSNMIQNTP